MDVSSELSRRELHLALAPWSKKTSDYIHRSKTHHPEHVARRHNPVLELMKASEEKKRESSRSTGEGGKGRERVSEDDLEEEGKVLMKRGNVCLHLRDTGGEVERA